MTTLVVGANGATGRLLVEQLLQRGQDIKIIVRTTSTLPDSIKNNKNVHIIQASILDLDDAEMARHVKGCNAVASCLGHNISFKGIYGKPRRLVKDATRRICGAIKANDPKESVRFVLMNTSGNSNRDLSEKISMGQKCIIRLLRLLLPPHADNEQAAEFLRTEIGQDDKIIEWVAVRPDGLIDESEVTEYEIYPSPIRSAIFSAGKVSRINVASFMAELLTDQELWMKWKGQMPVIYSKASL
ncbi:MAG: NAD(P)H-binding protein [Caldithrix sp.]|nr:NAD(P)H-binding protein [Caldithrix sp.]